MNCCAQLNSYVASNQRLLIMLFELVDNYHLYSRYVISIPFLTMTRHSQIRSQFYVDCNNISEMLLFNSDSAAVSASARTGFPAVVHEYTDIAISHAYVQFIEGTDHAITCDAMLIRQI